MIIIWGQKPYFKTQKVKSSGFCAHCERFVKRYSFNARTFFHLYYIPLIPTSARLRHHQSCAKCREGLALPIDQFEATVSELKLHSAEAMTALAEGEQTVTFDVGGVEGEPVDCISYLADVIDWLHDSGEQAFIAEMIEKLGQSQQGFAKQLLQAEMLRIAGRRREAIEQLQWLMSNHAEHSLPAKRAALLLSVEKRHVESAKAWNEALSRESDPHQRIGLMALRVDALMAGKQWFEAVQAYDDLFAAAPSIAEGKAAKKAYSKARAKAGVA